MLRLFALLLLLPLSLPTWAGRHTENLILITLDGVRIQEFFSGMDPLLADSAAKRGISEDEIVRERYWRETPEQRREALMPFFWKTLAPLGVVLGNPARGSSVQVSNTIRWSTPGYSEIMTGEAHPEVRDNTPVRYPHRTFPEFLVSELKLGKSAVAQIGSWDGFKMAASSTDDAFFMNGAYEAVPGNLSTPEMDTLTGLRADVMELWEESSNDVLSFRLAQAYLEKHHPRFLWLGLGQSDDWSHADRYDRLLDYLHLADRLIGELWSTLQADPAYRGKTSLVITTDHGRGLTPGNWIDHDATIPNSENIWLAVIGPDTPRRGELGPLPTVYQRDIAATVISLYGLDPARFNPRAGAPIAAVLE
ncbi:MAG: alkaline phosphatase family protein [Gammaproteobacteria bacterium]|jgi:hypothetical protein|nr:alkaline phosphatase family protein [Gammaproteobacteria bacterium]MBP6053342.1 alkaline phosphatase family protein [Pseudomonadales bacterium]MBK7520157.1 alkaline phosphatase family protein [Gammaproteobacteria bacterium]MBK7729624.1 alkaline phosphatase family protein [Gammaproteobacteria bacterium]MBK8308600.1 alkaline phosphatase family protein [Gammaproteobacteria bacterium]